MDDELDNQIDGVDELRVWKGGMDGWLNRKVD